MVYTLAGYAEAQDSATLVPAAALADQHLTIDGDGIIVPNDLTNIVAAYVGGPELTRAQLQSPSIRAFVDAELSPLGAAEEPGDPPEIVDLRRAPIVLEPDEELELHMAFDGAGAEQGTGLVFLADGPISPIDVPGARTVRATSSTAAVARTWTNVAITLGETLPAGRYAIVGLLPVSATMVAARLVVPGSGVRPGALGIDDEQGHGGASMFRNGNFGVMAEFDHNRQPTVDILCTTTDGTQVFLLDIVPI